MADQIVKGRIYPFGNLFAVPASKTIFDPVNYGVIAIKSRGEETMDLYKQFRDWLDYNQPGIKIEPLQEDLMKIALRSYDAKVAKTTAKTILREIAKAIVVADK